MEIDQEKNFKDSPALRQTETKQNESMAYSEAQNKGKGILFVCMRGTSRSRTAAGYAKRRGEKQTSSLDGGHEGLYHKMKSSNHEDIESALLTLCKKDVLRIFKDEGVISYDWLLRQLQDLVKEGKLTSDAYEIIEIATVYREVKQAGQDSQEFLLNAMAMLND